MPKSKSNRRARPAELEAEAGPSSSSAAAPDGTASSSRSFAHIGNKIKREELYRKHKKERREEKLKKRIARAKEEKGEAGREAKKARLATNIPRTIENTRDFNPRIISAPNTHPGRGPAAHLLPTEDDADEGEEEEEDDDDDIEPIDVTDLGDEDEEAAVEASAEAEQEADEPEDLDEDPHAPPALLITTSLPSNSTSPHLVSGNARSHPAERVRDFVNELLNVFPGAEYRERSKARGVGLGKIAGWARKRGYDGMLVVGEAKKEPVSLTIIKLPRGPTAFFRLTSISMGKEIYGHARPTPHTPELILNNFTTTLGHEVGTLLQSLFPRIPQLEGRQVLTAHNQRDYIFFRRHRYMFKSEDKTALQEIGPRFTLKLRKLRQGLPKGAGTWDGVIRFDGETADMDEKGEAVLEEVPLEKAKRGEEEDTGLAFEWKPKMGVSRRNFYL